MAPDLRPMRVVPGGIPDLANLVGRERETQQVLRSLAGHGCRLTGDRRYGKTSLTRLVEAECRASDRPVVRVSAERQSFGDFVSALADELAAADSAIKQEVDRWRISVHTGLMSGERAPTHRNLDELIRGAVQAHPEDLLVLIIDEVPVLAKAMNDQESGTGAELLHLLRRLRQDFSGRLAMVLSGSIGFHHVMHDALGVVNDIEPIAVGPLQPAEAIYLGRCLLLGETVPTNNDVAVGDAIAEAAENVPYYVHQLVKSARDLAARRAEPITTADVTTLVDQALIDPDDPWHLRHYRDRIPGYYGEEQQHLVAAILDIYADASAPLGMDGLRRRLDVADLEARPGRGEIVTLVELLEADHYLTRIGSDSGFASELVRRAWIARRR